jgi:hypothetical protein
LTTDRLERISISLLLALSALLPAVAAGETVPVDFHWSPPTEGAPVHFYAVYAARDDEAFRFEAVTHDTTYVLQAELGVEYRITVQGVTETGVEGAFSLPSDTVYLPETQPEYDGPPPTSDLRSNYPNPFNPETTIRYGIPETLAAGTRVLLEIYDVRGQRVKVLDADRSPGWHEVHWDGRSDSGDLQPSGHYILRLQAGTGVSTWKMTMVK